MRQKSSCPEHDVLRQLLTGALTGLDESAIEGHVDGCDVCQERLESLTYDEEGMPQTISCPDHSVLERMADGTLGTYAWETVEHHLETCKGCQADFDAQASGEDDWSRRVKSLRRQGASESPGLKRVIGALKEESGFESETGFRPHLVDQAETLSFLDPSNVPGDLGKLGPYRVLEVLGSGGMGIVLKAFDPTLNRPVAIKVLAPQLATSGPARQRFAREARAAAAIRNEHVVAIHAVDEWKGLPFLVMEFIPGNSLQERIDRSAPLDVNAVLRIGMQTAAGLAAAHAQGIVHRDIKPSNILLENGVERVKITDFGLARAVDDASLTQSGVVAGTPLFMAPEQARCETIDHRADLFSLGSVLYAMCTGRSPFRASTTLGVLRRVCDDGPRPVREVNPEVPDWLTAVIERLLAKDRADRYQSAEEVYELLESHLARRQEGTADESETRLEQPPAALVAEVGPLKAQSVRTHWQELFACLVVILSGLFVLTEVTGVTHVLDRLKTFVGGSASDGTLVLEVRDPEISVRVDGRTPWSLLFSRTGLRELRLRPGWHTVEIFKGQKKIDWYHVPITSGGRESLTLGGTHEAGPAGEAGRPIGPKPEAPLAIKEALNPLKKAETIRDLAIAAVTNSASLAANAKANAATSKREYDRLLALARINAVNPTLLNDAKTRLDADEAHLQAAQAEVQAAWIRFEEAEKALKPIESNRKDQTSPETRSP